uniref:Uncharacterized protein n=1 Tax=Polytomella parva TaxID=51329 RepID=A0A7S0VC81_9CHLO|mmetsp:Transcript_32723/g.59307  ORF Transcript_32723/g.59307 Transcript_32723/m.59307 type:complete len:146 (+) Transcript_32723:77-514(+)
MTTRGSLARERVKEHFEGRVRKWERQWTSSAGFNFKQESKVKFLKWIPLAERSDDIFTSRHPQYKMVSDFNLLYKLAPFPGEDETVFKIQAIINNGAVVDKSNSNSDINNEKTTHLDSSRDLGSHQISTVIKSTSCQQNNDAIVT